MINQLLKQLTTVASLTLTVISITDYFLDK